MKANWLIKYNGKVYNTGDKINPKDFNKSDLEELIKSGAISKEEKANANKSKRK